MIALRRESVHPPAEILDATRSRGLPRGRSAVTNVRSRARSGRAARRPRRSGFSRPPIGAVWGWAQTGRGSNGHRFAALRGSVGAVAASRRRDHRLRSPHSRKGEPLDSRRSGGGDRRARGWLSPMTRPAPRDIAEVRHREWHRALDVLAVPQANRVELGIADGELTESRG